MAFFTTLKKIIICMEIQNAKAIWRKKNRTGGIRLPDFRVFYKATAVKTI